jgi:hypothetical protein
MYVEYGTPIWYMGKYANIGAQLNRIEKDIDAVRRNINDASTNA